MRKVRAPRAFMLDVDDVLLEMERSVAAAEKALAKEISARLGAIEAGAVQARLTRQYETLKTELRRTSGEASADARVLRQRIVGWQRGVSLAGHEVKLWSREVMLAIALEDGGHRPDGPLIRKAVDAYWDTVAEASTLHPDAKRLLDALIGHGVPFHLATNSDGFLDLDPSGRTFLYDPSDARARKLGRLRPIWAGGVKKEAVTIGDPVGKPHPAFFARALADFEAQLGERLELGSVVAVGDSWSNDVAPFLKAGVGQGVLILRGQPPPSALGPSAKVIEQLVELL